MKTSISVLIVYIIVAALSLTGYFMNIVKFIKSDFEAPYKNEIIRGVGIPVGVVGAVVGYIDIKD